MTNITLYGARRSQSAKISTADLDGIRIKLSGAKRSIVEFDGVVVNARDSALNDLARLKDDRVKAK